MQKKPSIRNLGGVAAVLEHAKQEMTRKMIERLQQRIEQGRSNLSAEEAETIARIAGQMAREICADSIGEAFQLGVNSTAKAEDYERDTERIKS